MGCRRTAAQLQDGLSAATGDVLAELQQLSAQPVRLCEGGTST